MKQKAIRDPEWLKAVRGKGCIICGRTPCDPAHVRTLGMGGMGMKPGDDHVLPLCRTHHMEQHQIGEKSFWTRAIVSDPLLVFIALQALAQKEYQDFLRNQVK